MLVWPMAAKAPSAMEAMEMNITICCHWNAMPGTSGPNGPKGAIIARVKSASAAILGARPKNAVIGVGAPS